MEKKTSQPAVSQAYFRLDLSTSRRRGNRSRVGGSQLGPFGSTGGEGKKSMKNFTSSAGRFVGKKLGGFFCSYNYNNGVVQKKDRP